MHGARFAAALPAPAEFTRAGAYFNLPAPDEGEIAFDAA
jgi:hypothetical protein